jgi:polyisoprenoid-binding protein YceI
MATESSRSTEWEIDPAHTSAHFSVRHLMVSTVRGEFTKVTGKVALDEADPTRSQVEVEVDAASVNTREPKRDAHLRSADFFDVEKFPRLSFRSTRIQRGGDGLALTGDLTMHGVTRPVTLNVELSAAVKDHYGRTVRGVSATGKLNRKDWGLGWNAALEAGGVVIGEDVTLQIDAEFVAKAPGAAAR